MSSSHNIYSTESEAISKKLTPEQELERYRKNSITAAKELFYPAFIIEGLMNAVSEIEIERLLIKGRALM